MVRSSSRGVETAKGEEMATVLAEDPALAPRPQPVATVPLLATLIAGPAAWITQLVFGYGWSSYACYPFESPRLQAPPAWPGEPWALLALNLACLAVSLAAGALSLSHLRRARRAPSRPRENLAEIARDRTIFLATCAAFSGFGFALATAFNTLEPIMISTCWRMA